MAGKLQMLNTIMDEKQRQQQQMQVKRGVYALQCEYHDDEQPP